MMADLGKRLKERPTGRGARSRRVRAIDHGTSAAGVRTPMPAAIPIPISHAGTDGFVVAALSDTRGYGAGA